MEKYLGIFADGYQTTVWSTDVNNARYHLNDWCRLHGDLLDVKLLIPCPEDDDNES